MPRRPHPTPVPTDPYAWIVAQLQAPPPPGAAEKRSTSQKSAAIGNTCLIVEALLGDNTAEDVSAAYSQWRRAPEIFRPLVMAWRADAPSGRSYFLFIWNPVKRESLPRFKKFFAATGRKFGELGEDLVGKIGSEEIDLRQCRLVHHDDIVSATTPRSPKQTQNQRKSAKLAPVGLRLVKQLLAKSPGDCECVQAWEFRSDHEAHDEELTARYYAEADEAHAAMEQGLCHEFGPPASAGDSNQEIPLCGILRCALWELDDCKLYLASAHEDRGLPILLMMGTLARN
jgi:hypothetical protein